MVVSSRASQKIRRRLERSWSGNAPWIKESLCRCDCYFFLLLLSCSHALFSPLSLIDDSHQWLLHGSNIRIGLSLVIESTHQWCRLRDDAPRWFPNFIDSPFAAAPRLPPLLNLASSTLLLISLPTQFIALSFSFFLPGMHAKSFSFFWTFMQFSCI